MDIEPTQIDGILVTTPTVFRDSRGHLMETFQLQRFAAAGIPSVFVQDNFSYSTRNTLRGLHFQNPNGQAKLIQAVQGEIYDVAVDIRKGSPTFGQWFGIRLSSTNHRQVFIAAGLAHGFCVLSREARVTYKCSAYYEPENEAGILWSDPDIGIDWPVDTPALSPKDQGLPRLKDIPPQRLPGMV